MADKTKIDWCDASWNPVTGCEHGCEYCYARRMAKRYSYEGQTLDAPCELQRVWIEDRKGLEPGLHVLRYAVQLKDNGRIVPYPFGFAPTFHRYRLDIPARWQRPRTIFVCSMADLFGAWVPDEWITDVFEACGAAGRHRYLFLTKNPKRYIELHEKRLLPGWKNMWYGTSVTNNETEYFFSAFHNTFASIEPIHGDFDPDKEPLFNWAIIGAETGNRKDRVVQERAWIDHVVPSCRRNGIPVFMKESLRGIMGADFIQEYPWG